MAKQSRICLACPRSCELRPQIAGAPGQKLCPQGQSFVAQETREPLRHYFSTVKHDDGSIHAYRTIEPVSQQAIDRMCESLKNAKSASERNQLHQQFCRDFPVRLTRI